MSSRPRDADKGAATEVIRLTVTRGSLAETASSTIRAHCAGETPALQEAEIHCWDLGFERTGWVAERAVGSAELVRWGGTGLGRGVVVLTGGGGVLGHRGMIGEPG